MGLMGDNSWRIKVSANGSGWVDAITVNATTGAATFAAAPRPAGDNTMTLGASGARWSAVWAATGTIQTSDSRHKARIAPSDLGLDFICALRPVRFSWKEDDGYVHYGLIARRSRRSCPAIGSAAMSWPIQTSPKASRPCATTSSSPP
jgi:hypothetical protein